MMRTNSANLIYPLLALSLSFSAGCSDDPVDPGDDAKGGSASGGSGAGGDGTGGDGTGGDGAGNDRGGITSPSECSEALDPEVCFTSEGPEGYGGKCMARKIQDTPNGRLEFRQTWAKSVLPPQSDAVAQILAPGNALPEPECNASDGHGGYSAALIVGADGGVGHYGYSGYVEPTEAASVREKGLCILKFTHNDPKAVYAAGAKFAEPKFEAPGAEPKLLPWEVGFSNSESVPEDFTITDEIRKGGKSVTYIDRETGYLHNYNPLSHSLIYSAKDTYVAVPLHESELEVYFDPNGACVGRYNHDRLSPDTDCWDIKATPMWGCDDPDGSRCFDKTAPARSKGYFMMVETEQIFSTTLQQTTCVTQLGGPEAAIESGWAAKGQVNGAQGTWCRLSPKWDPSLPNDEGLPPGDWCSKTNGPATDDCHDSMQNLTYQAYQAFPVADPTQQTCTETDMVLR